MSRKRLWRKTSWVAMAVLCVAVGSKRLAGQTLGPCPDSIAKGDSLYFYLSIGSSRPLHPGAFSSDWQSGIWPGRRHVALRLAAVYRLDGKKSVFIGFEHASFSAPTILENPEIRLFTIIPGLRLSHPTHLATPYVRVGAGLVRQGLRRMRIDDGSFRYTGSITEFDWSTGLGLNAAFGTTINVSRGLFPYVEASYIVTRASGVTVGHITFRVGVGMALGRFLRGVSGLPQPGNCERIDVSQACSRSGSRWAGQKSRS